MTLRMQHRIHCAASPARIVFRHGAMLALGLALWAANTKAQNQPVLQTPSAGPPELLYTNEFFPSASYHPQVPTQAKVIGFGPAQRAASVEEIERCLKAWTAAAPERARLVEYARSHEGRPLHYVVVTAPRNLSRLETIQAGLARLGDPRKLSEAEARQLIAELPAVAWLAYTIHGDETEGSDAALAILYHLLAAQDPNVDQLLNEVVVIIDPVMNPDGRDRFVKMITEHRGASPNLDDQSLLHAGYWPRGRGNHYLFDLNRDWILGVHPESQGRLREVARWNPQLFVDAHGMGPQETHLFSPPREPINPNLPKDRAVWGQLFAREQGRAFDRVPLHYYTGEWHEEWYPGYSDGWASYRGAIGILYEQARIAEDGVRRPEGRVLSYRESVHHHIIGSMANLNTLRANAKKLLEYYYQQRQAAVDSNGPYARRTFAVLPAANQSRWDALVRLLQLEGFELHQAGEAFTAPTAVDQLGRSWTNRVVPPGTLLVQNRQPLAHLLAAMLEFDPRLSPAALEQERREILGRNRSRIYDTTAWNLTMMFGLEALTLAQELPATAKSYAAKEPPPPLAGQREAPVAYIVDGADDRSVAAAARLMEQGVQVRVADKPCRFDDREFARGSVFVTRLDNRQFRGDLAQTVAGCVQALGLSAMGVSTGFGPGDLPDLGGEHFRRLEPPRIALLGRGGFNSQDYGAIWYVLDHHLGARHSHLDEAGPMDLSRYNVLVAPAGRGGGLASNLVNTIKEWVKTGGSLIVVGDTAASFMADKADFSKVRQLPEVLNRLPEYELAVLREWLARFGPLPGPDALWTHKATAGLQYPWQALEGPLPEEKEIKRRDAWQALFMPQGALLAGRVDTNHWLTAGCTEPLPLLVGKQPILMAAEGVAAPIRYGCLSPVPKATNRLESAEAQAKPETTPEKKEKKEPPRLGWCALPEGTEMHLRMSGLLWPEAAQRLANAAWVTREPYGRGQVVIFATPPAFRASARGAERVLLNALVCGPGFGAAQPIRP